MQESYVGLISHRGLESFWQEHEHTARFLERRLQRDRIRSCLGYWAVIDESAARIVTALLDAGRTQDAWLSLQCFAERLGAVIPETTNCEEPLGNSSGV